MSRSGWLRGQQNKSGKAGNCTCSLRRGDTPRWTLCSTLGKSDNSIDRSDRGKPATVDHLLSSARNLFSSATVNRAPEYRLANHELTALATGANARFLPILGSQVFVSRTDAGYVAATLAHSRFEETFDAVGPIIYLGLFNDQQHFAVDVKATGTSIHDNPGFGDLRQVAPLLSADDCTLLGYARAMVHWQQGHRFCGRCGAANEAESGGHVLRCGARSCGRQHFPRTDPAIIVLVEDGSFALFGRQAQWPSARYSTIAGFVEPGESAEQAVVREVAEETGVEVTGMRYHSSQPWPFPGTLMLGYLASAGANAISLNDNELEDAKWLSRRDVEAQMQAGTFIPPPPISISFSLIEAWFDQDADVPLKKLRETCVGSDI